MISQVKSLGLGEKPFVWCGKDFDGRSQGFIFVDSYDPTDCLVVELEQAVEREDSHLLEKELDKSGIEFILANVDDLFGRFVRREGRPPRSRLGHGDIGIDQPYDLSIFVYVFAGDLIGIPLPSKPLVLL